MPHFDLFVRRNHDPFTLYFHVSTWCLHKKGTQDLTEQAWLLCLTLNQNDALRTVHNVLKYLMDNDSLCCVVVFALQKCKYKTDTQFLQVIFFPAIRGLSSSIN